MLPEAVTKYLLAHRDRHLGELCELLSIPSMATVADGSCTAAAEWLRAHLGRLGLDAQIALSGGPPNVLAERRTGADRPTLLVYGHYDVQPPDPLEAWETPPFNPQVRGGCLFARGASDDKGQLFAHLMAIEAWQQAGGLPVDLKIFIEGEEEIGSPHLEAFLAAHAQNLGAEAAVISDSEFFADGLPSITTGLRGLAYVEVTVRGPAADLHSGVHGGAVRNPADVLAALVAALHDQRGRITIPGFYDGVLKPSAAEQAAWAQLPFDEREYADSLGVKELTGGERGVPVLRRRWSRPSLDCNGIVAGYTGPGAKTIIPASATAKLSMRLVPRQQPDKVIGALQRHLHRLCPPGVTLEFQVLSSARPVLLATDSPAMRAARAAVAEAFGREPVFIRCGASVPVTEQIQRVLGLDAVLMGFGLPSDNPHSPNEHLRLEQLWRGSIAAAAFMQNLAHARGKGA